MIEILRTPDSPTWSRELNLSFVAEAPGSVSLPGMSQLPQGSSAGCDGQFWLRKPSHHLHLGPGHRLRSLVIFCTIPSVPSAAEGQVALVSLLSWAWRGMWESVSSWGGQAFPLPLPVSLWRRGFHRPNGELQWKLEPYLFCRFSFFLSWVDAKI